MHIQLHAVALTDPGAKREENEDTVFSTVVPSSNEDGIGLFIVADGVGGRLAGQAASYWAVESIQKSFADLIEYRDPRATHRFTREQLQELVEATEAQTDNLAKRVVAAVEKANDVVRDYALHKPAEAQGASSTLTMALVYGRQAIVANVGDSRTYLLRGNDLVQITVDHSLVQRLIDAGTIKSSERFTHPQRNLIYRSLGAKDEIKVDRFPLYLDPGDHLLLCTDGLWEMVQDPTAITHIIQNAPSLAEAGQRLIDAANAAGGEDNIGLVLVRVHG